MIPLTISMHGKLTNMANKDKKKRYFYVRVEACANVNIDLIKCSVLLWQSRFLCSEFLWRCFIIK